jgi:4-hydroxy-tetrahydrodipicolinate reductase
MKIIISGALGTMGCVLAKVAAMQNIEIAAGVESFKQGHADYPIFKCFNDCPKADVIVDFSHPSNIASLLEYAKEKSVPVVIGTTGMSQSDIDLISKYSESIPIFFTFNMSLGVNLLAALSEQAAKVLGGSFDIEVLEKHHNKKIDAPSGTAIMLAKAVSDGLGFNPKLVYERQSKRQARGADEVGIHSIRGGTIVGDHSVIFAGEDEIVTLSHSAFSKNIFAVGALKASEFIVGCRPGLYSMKDLLKR